MLPDLCLVASLSLLCQAAMCAPAELVAEWGNLEGSWRFRTDPGEVGEQEGWHQVDLNEAEWGTLRVPGCWEAQGVTEARPGEPPHPRNGMPWSDYDGVAWYRLHFIVPAAWAGKELLLHLGSVDDEDRTYLNGELVGSTGPGIARSVHVQRRYVVGPHRVRFGEENVLVVRVRDGGGPGGLMGPLLTLLPGEIAHMRATVPPSDRPFAERFADPPADARILKIIHSWPDSPQEQDALIRDLLLQGFGGVVCNVSFDQYLESETKWAAFVRAVESASQAGMCLWLYDEHGYPSGTAGGITLRGHPEWEARGLLVAEATSEGGEVTLDLPPGTLVRAAAFPVTPDGLDLAGGLDLAASLQDRKLAWHAPPGRWHVMLITEDRLYEGTHAEMSLALKLPYINLLMPEPTARFLEVTHDAYARRLGPDLGRWFVATFTDEPSLVSHFMRPMPYRPLPWAPDLPAHFRQRRGYDLEPLLPLLIAGSAGAERKVRHDFWLTVGELVADNFFGQIQERCRRYGLLSGGHLLAEEDLLASVSFYGDFFRCLRRLDAPGIDCLTSLPPEVPWYIARLVSSVADLEGRTLTMCETSDFSQRYRPAGDDRPLRQVTEEEIRGTCNRLIWGGINTITSYYSFDALTTSQLRRLNQWVGRCCTALRGGHQVADIALVYPNQSVWPHYVPGRQWTTDAVAAQVINATFGHTRDALWNAGRDFTFVDGRALAQATAAGGSLVHGNLRWRAVILPRADTLPLAAWENLARFWRAGGAVVAVGALPANSETGFPDPRVQELATEMLAPQTGPSAHTNPAGGVGVWLPPGSETLLPVVLDALLEPDVALPSGSPLHATHRRIAGHEIFFIINDSPQPWSGQVAVSADGEGELLDPATGTSLPVTDPRSVALDLPPYGGILLRFPEPRLPRRLAPVEGLLHGLHIQTLPLVEPKVGKGEFVQARVSPDTEYAREDRPAWRAVGTLTRGNTDTFLFLSFSYPAGINLSTVDNLVVESWVPQGQSTPSHLLVILCDQDGGQYLADTGRPLALPGHHQSFVPLTAFQPARWATDPNERLDLDRITAINIGWGGYYGSEGERVEFSVALPGVIRMAR